jgi:hypothetical protein
MPSWSARNSMPDIPESGPGLVHILAAAAEVLRKRDIAPYLRLRGFVRDGMSGDREDFAGKFSAYYGLNRAGLSSDFKAAYFRLLFAYRVDQNDDPHTPILLHLYEFPRLQGDQIVAASFTSKLVAIHDEAQPLFDRHVTAFFGIGVPTFGSLDFRIAGFVQNLQQIRRTYEAWSQIPSLAAVTGRVKQERPVLKDTHHNRIWDFLVWIARARLAPLLHAVQPT